MRPQYGRRQEISEKTGFDVGVEFTTEDDVRAYFTTHNMDAMYGGNLMVDYPELCDQTILDEMAANVIEARWHCTF